MFDPKIITAFKQHAIQRFPEEACGFIVNNEFLPMENIHENPTEAFTISKEDYPLSGLQAVLHSHPRGELQPSKEDMQGQLITAVPWGLVKIHKPSLETIEVSNTLFWGAGVKIPPLVGRKFRHGPSGSDGGGDCYALIKDYYYIKKGIILPEFPRNEDWYATENLYTDNFEKAGFERIGKGEVKAGDVILSQFPRSKTPNHGAIYLGDGTVLHHLQNQLSVREPISKWVPYITHYLRYNK